MVSYLQENSVSTCETVTCYKDCARLMHDPLPPRQKLIAWAVYVCDRSQFGILLPILQPRLDILLAAIEPLRAGANGIEALRGIKAGSASAYSPAKITMRT